MLEVRTHKTLGSLVLAGAVCLAGAGLGQAATPLRLAGAITGFVTDAAGVPEMGAAGVLLNRQERQFERALTDDRRAFRFLGLTPDLYSDRKSTRLNSSHRCISYAVFCLKK